MHAYNLVLVFLSLMVAAIDDVGAGLLHHHHHGDHHHHHNHHHLLDLLHVDLGLNLFESLGIHDHTSQFLKVYDTAAPLLAKKSVGDSITVLLFDDVSAGHQAVYIEKLKKDPVGCATLIQEHTFGPAHHISELLVKGTVINLNGKPITFVSTDGGHTVRANGRLVTQHDIDLGNNIIGHRIEGFILPHVPEKHTAEVVPALLGGVLGVVGSLLNYVTTLLEGFLDAILGGAGLSHDAPMTFIVPADEELHSLKTSYKTLGPLFAKPAFEKTIKEHMYLGSYSPLELTEMTELTNIAGQKKAIIKQDDGFLKIGETIMDPYKVLPTKNGFAYSPTLESIDIRSHPATKLPVKNPATRSISDEDAAAVEVIASEQSSKEAVVVESDQSAGGATNALSKMTAVSSATTALLPTAEDVLSARNLPAKIGTNLPKVPDADAVKDLTSSTDDVLSARSLPPKLPASSLDTLDTVTSTLPVPLPVAPSSLIAVTPLNNAKGLTPGLPLK